MKWPQPVLERHNHSLKPASFGQELLFKPWQVVVYANKGRCPKWSHGMDQRVSSTFSSLAFFQLSYDWMQLPSYENYDLWDTKCIYSVYVFILPLHLLWLIHPLSTDHTSYAQVCHPSELPFIWYNTTSQALMKVTALLDVTAPVIILSHRRPHALWW